jgi:hypothetical protein
VPIILMTLICPVMLYPLLPYSNTPSLLLFKFRAPVASKTKPGPLVSSSLLYRDYQSSF